MNLSTFQLALQSLKALNQAGSAVAGSIANRQTSKALKDYGNVLAEDELRRGRALLGEQRVAFAKAGVDPGTGTALTLQQRQRTVNYMTAERAKYPSRLQRYRLGQSSAFEMATGITEAGTTLGQGVVDYYRNQKPKP